jgi:glycosyltransferase involved in cell wall biosynthesis
MKFSIAMATFNGARFLEEQLISIRDQTVRPAELVICDDASSDETVVVAERFARTAPFDVRIERNERNLGHSDNFLKAASLCRHEWIAFSDQDDVWDEAKLETIRNVVQKRPPVNLVAHRATLVDERLRPIGGLLPVPPVRKLTILPRMSRNFWLHPYGFTMAFNGRLVRDFPIDTRPVRSFDRWIFVVATALGQTALLPGSLALYRRHSTNFSSLISPPPWSSGLLDPKTHQRFAEVAELYRALSVYFGRCARSASAEDAEALRNSATSYQTMAERFKRRLQLYSPSASLPGRTRTYVAMLSRGAYAPYDAGGLGWRAGLRDLAYVALNTVLR